ncbi:MAG: DUF4260 domain-containing protein [Bacteroidota bacterium]
MKNIIKLEELAMFLFGIYLFNQLHYSWWWFPALILLPDLSMMGYLVNQKIGGYFYNFAHHKAIALVAYIAGIYFHNSPLQLAGIILFAHSSMDRMFGYGLKYSDSFHNTHLGMIGKNK